MGESFTDYAERAHPVLQRAAFRLTADWHEAEDLAQRTLITLYRRWEALDGHGRLGAYAYTVMLRLLISDRRARRSTEIPTGTPPEPAAPGDLAGQVADRLALAAALDLLTPAHRTVLVLRFLEDRSVEETARLLGAGPSTIRSQTSRALAALRAHLEASTPEEARGDRGG